MGDAEHRTDAEPREFIGGVYSNYKVKAFPPSIRLLVSPQELQFRLRGLARILGQGPWTVGRDEVREVFAKRRTTFPPRDWHVEIVTVDPAVWWTFWSPQQLEPLLLCLEECGYPVNWTPHNWAGLPVE